MTRVICPEVFLATQQVSSTVHRIDRGAVRPRAQRRHRHIADSLGRPLAAWRRWTGVIAGRRRARAAILAQLPSVPGERVLRILCDDSGAWLVPTQRALYVQTDGRWSRIGWEQVLRISSDDERHAMVVLTMAPEGSRRTTLYLKDSGSLLDLARERVASTLLLSSRLPLGDHGSAVITGRRPPGSSETVWQVSLDGQVDRADPVVEAKIMAGIEALRGHLDA